MTYIERAVSNGAGVTEDAWRFEKRWRPCKHGARIALQRAQKNDPPLRRGAAGIIMQ
jgi:hypothetical protein